MRVIAFDLSSVCIGVIAAEINEDKKITLITTCPIIPQHFDPASLGYSSNRKKIKTATGESINAYMKIGEEKVSRSTAKLRNSEVRRAKDLFVLEQISKSIANIIKSVEPDLILVEKNAIFNGILTSVLLAKIMGVLLGVAGTYDIPVKEFTVTEARRDFNTANLCKELTARLTEEQIRKIPDITKRALRVEMEKIYDLIFLTDDESDACVIFHYWYEKFKKGEQ